MKNTKYCFSDLIKDLKIDVGKKSGTSILCAAYHFLFNPSVKVLFYYRLSHWFHLKGFSRFAYAIRYLQCKYGCYISQSAILGKGLRLPHPIGVVVGDGAIVEDNVTIYQNVTIGSHGKKNIKPEYPYIESGVIIYTGAVLIGGIRIGKNAVIGANSVILSDIAPNSVAVGVPYKSTRH